MAILKRRAVSSREAIYSSLTSGPGYCLSSLTPPELAWVRDRIRAQYLDRIGRLQPDLLKRARTAGIENYHTLAIAFDHASSWPKESRLLDARCVAEFSRMQFFRTIRRQFGDSARISHDELNWRLVRPECPDDIGPVHADRWFWDAGYGYGVMPAGYDRFKIWIAVYTEPGLNGLTVKSGSHRVHTWKHHFERRGGITKPVLDENEDQLQMELLPLGSGQMVLFHDELLHGGALNRGQACRISIELTVLFNPAEAKRRREGKGSPKPVRRSR
jgi:hypothetical protein